MPTPDQWKIYLPTSLLENAVKWYHLALGHLGMSRLTDTISEHLYHPDIRKTVEDIAEKCIPCQECKVVGKVYGHAAASEAVCHPWRDIAVDHIGPWTLTIGKMEEKF
jgi:hypothetical protein